MHCRLAIEAPEPSLFPEDQTSSFAPVMRRSITASVLQVNRIRHLSTTDPDRGITGLVSSLVNPDCHSAILKHLGGSSSRRPFASNVLRISSFDRPCTHHGRGVAGNA